MPEPTLPAPQPGDLVHFVMPADSRSAGQVRPAFVVRSFDANPADVMLNLQVFTDGSNDRLAVPSGPIDQDPYSKGMVWRTSVHHDPAGETPSTWHRPMPPAPPAPAPVAEWQADVYRVDRVDPADRGEGG